MSTGSADSERLALAGVAVVGGVMLWPKARNAVVDVFVRGEKLSTSHMVNDVVVENPAALAGEAASTYGMPFSREVYAAARMSRSEGGSPAEKRLKLHVLFNDAQGLGWSVEKTLLYADDLDTPGGNRHPTAAGHYGRQYTDKVNPRAQRRFSSARDPYRGDVDLVLSVMDERDQHIDPTGGARKFIDKDAMGGGQPGTTTYERKAAQWAAAGWAAVPIENTDLVLFRRA